MPGLLYQQPTSLLGSPDEPQGLLGALYQNPLLARQFARQKQFMTPPESVTDPRWAEHQARQRQADEFLLGADVLGAAAPFAKPLGLLAGRMAGPAVESYMAKTGLLSPVTAWHGSPHKFDALDFGRAGKDQNRGGTSFGLGINLSKDPKHANVYKGDGGHLYKVDLPDEELRSFIRWERPVPADLAKQIPEIDFSKPIPFGGGATVENANGQWLLKTGDSAFRLSEREVERMFAGDTGEQVYRRLVAALGDERAASEWLKAKGVKGIANNTERNAENFVVFDDSILKIIGRE
jgi:hypothetical protein